MTPTTPATATTVDGTTLPAALRLAGVTLRLGSGAQQVTALDRVDLTVARGEFLALTGPSGSGKSSLLAVAGGLQSPSEGTVHVAGTDLTTLTEGQRTAHRRNHIGYVFQHANLLASLTAREQLLVAAHIAGRLDGSARQRADELLDAVGMTARADRRPHQLSGGERQRVGLARALLLAPEILLVDEPTSALDRARSRDIVDLIARQTRAQNTATVMVTHDTEILDAADRVRNLRDGRLT
ncbi:ABC transporter ATP-binding protein [Actinocatenispora sera]|jgi:putative ABC transport system ATP-binding protein|uniref:ABC transporter ATP-binding protein n=1 Tax=Actinocatenispora sera TaxID=390989 RepID=A0A810LEL9_9ACTN|nr:ABC transporter ATP-binding protein [Actinocatenispora sera]BCJ32398.1 ABC transporter ATP-binding protein [Actinocatenispora sera]